MITVFEVADSASAAALIGHIVPVRIDSAAPRLLMGSLEKALGPPKRAGREGQAVTINPI
jgi:hypothetical protein